MQNNKIDCTEKLTGEIDTASRSLRWARANWLNDGMPGLQPKACE